jgi:hypothetical protein
VSADFQKLLRVLAAGNVDFIIVGGLAATIHGAARATYDVDVVYARTPDNMARWWRRSRPCNPTCAAHLQACRFRGALTR